MPYSTKGEPPQAQKYTKPTLLNIDKSPSINTFIYSNKSNNGYNTALCKPSTYTNKLQNDSGINIHNIEPRLKEFSEEFPKTDLNQ